jgi:hypothetical protein
MKLEVGFNIHKCSREGVFGFGCDFIVSLLQSFYEMPAKI